jgi:predicted amidohydrolase YtcJ
MPFQIRNCNVFTRSGKIRNVNLLISQSKIVSIIEKKYSTEKLDSSNVYEAGGRIVLPAFIDCHCHLFSLAEKDEEVQLYGCRSISEMQERIRSYLNFTPKERSTWIFGRGWDQDLFVEKRMPVKEDLDLVSDDTPIVMTRVCGHVAVANSSALDFFRLAGAFRGIAKELLPADVEGHPLGIIKENALNKCRALIPKPSFRKLQRFFLRGQSIALRYGISAVHCILDDLNQFNAIKKLDQKGKVKMKVILFLPIDSLEQIEHFSAKSREKILCGNKIRAIGFKLFADGSLGARTAALNEDYSDDPGNQGILNYSDSQIVDFAKRVKKMGLVLATHAIGDRAVEQVARAYRRAGISSKHQFRIEHCSVIKPRRISSLSEIVLSVQPMFATSDYWLKERIGRDRTKRVGYAFRSLFKKNCLIGGSDAPVESIDPLTGIGAAIENMVDSKESLSLIQAVQMYTLNAAGLSTLTKNSGAIAIGKDCNLVILDAVDYDSIPKSRVVELFIDGKRIRG